MNYLMDYLITLSDEIIRSSLSDIPDLNHTASPRASSWSTDDAPITRTLSPLTSAACRWTNGSITFPHAYATGFFFNYGTYRLLPRGLWAHATVAGNMRQARR